MAKSPSFVLALYALFCVSCSTNGDNSTSQEPTSRYRFKTGSYIEATRNEIFSLCPPDKKTEGTWISEHSVSLNAENCLSVQTPNLAGTFDILFMENSGHTDTVQVLVDQSYIEMENYSHRIWTTDLMEYYDSDDITIRGVIIREMKRRGRYENRSYNQTLIVDKTKFTVVDAWHYSKMDSRFRPFTPFQLEREYKNVNLEESKLPYVDGYTWMIANIRSKKEGLDTAYVISKDGLVLDTLASGYRLPFEDEWYFLMRAGASTVYYWGDEWDPGKEEDRLKISRYAWVCPTELKPVAQLLPNAFGLYDMAGIAIERFEQSPYGYKFGYLCPEYEFMIKIKTVDMPHILSGYESFRLLRKTPKLYKLEKF
jgi:hypothetical protein